jgi:hypothetical protein
MSRSSSIEPDVEEATRHIAGGLMRLPTVQKVQRLYLGSTETDSYDRYLMGLNVVLTTRAEHDFRVRSYKPNEVLLTRIRGDAERFSLEIDWRLRPETPVEVIWSVLLGNYNREYFFGHLMDGLFRTYFTDEVTDAIRIAPIEVGWNWGYTLNESRPTSQIFDPITSVFK